MLRSALLAGLVALGSFGMADSGPILARDQPRVTGLFEGARRHEFRQVHMGLPVRIVLYAGTEAEARAAARGAFDRIALLDRMMSDYRGDSALRALERGAGEWTIVSPELHAVLARALAIADASGGAFDPTAGAIVALWREARRTGRRPSPAALEEARALVGWQHLEIDPRCCAVRLARPGMRLDLGGIAKGYILQSAVDTLAAHGVSSVLIEAGGDIVVGDAPPGRDGWRIDVPEADASFTARAHRLANGALATSGPAAQYAEIDGVRYSHTVDPRSGKALTSGVTAHVIARDGATADALATALTVLGPGAVGDVLQRFPGTAAMVTGPR
jgi:FAD:protein FMN transferase